MKSHLPLLAIDTSTSRAYAAVRLADGSIHESVSRDAVSHNEELSKIILEALTNAGISPEDLLGVVVGSGPGSFTGLRIGYSVAKGMAFSLSIPLAEISSHRAAALGAGVPSGSVVVIGDARRDEYFCSGFRIARNGAEVEELLRAHILPAANLSRLLGQFPADQLLHLVSETPIPVEIKLATMAPKALATGLALSIKDEDFQAVSASALADSAPAYLRAVAAKTIAERSAEKVRKGV